MKRKILKISLMCLFVVLFFTKAAAAAECSISSDAECSKCINCSAIIPLDIE